STASTAPTTPRPSAPGRAQAASACSPGPGRSCPNARQSAPRSLSRVSSGPSPSAARWTRARRDGTWWGCSWGCTPPGRTRAPGAQGLEVVDLQRALDALGLDAGDADGGDGPHAEAAVRKLQRLFGLPEDGRAWADVYYVLGLKGPAAREAR